MRSLSFPVVITILLFPSCKKDKENYMEITKTNKATTKTTYEKGNV
ncbi:hypothetical protein J2Y40_004631 [Chryseobacterium sp. 2987]|nr:hypothetical protein [Chryseobacterium sp. 2987]